MTQKRSALTALVALTAGVSLTLSGCSSDSTTNDSASSETATAAASTAASESITVTDNYGEKTVNLPVGKVASTDNRSFALLDEWGVDLVAAPKPLIPFTLEGYKKNDDIVDLGNHREPDLEALAAAQPDLIVNGQRFERFYDDIVKPNPQATVLDFEPREDEDLDEELIRQTEELGRVFGKEKGAEKTVKDFKDALEHAKKAAKDAGTVMAVNVTGGEVHYIAPKVGRTYGPLFDLLDLKPALEVEEGSSNHKGDDISVEAIAKSNPDWIVVLDRDGATNKREESDYVLAQKVIEDNAALDNVTALKEGQVYYAPQDTYTNESIVTYTKILNGLADAFESGKGNSESDF